jgi:pimeloyl-ACP methyl ester carboxylesterase
VDVEHGTMGGLPYAALGEGPPLVVLAGLSPTTGVGGKWGVWTMLGPVASLAGTRRLFVFNRRPHLPRGLTMSAIAAEHADALREGFGTPVDVLGASTGGSIAQQLAADHPEVVRRLVLISTACRLGEWGRTLQRRVAARVRAGAHRQALAVLAADLVPNGPVGIAAGAGAWLLGPAAIKGPDDLDDMATTIEAEDTFDLSECERQITAPTLILAGSEDQAYGRELFEETARLIAGSDLQMFAGRGHVNVMSDPRFLPALSTFLA